jgi:hypothetical protein
MEDWIAGAINSAKNHIQKDAADPTIDFQKTAKASTVVVSSLRAE